MRKVPGTFNISLTEEDFKSNLDKVAEGAVADACTGTNPREISVEEMMRLFFSSKSKASLCVFYRRNNLLYR